MILGGIKLGVAVHLLLVLLRPTGMARWMEERAVDWMIYGAGFQPAHSQGALDPAFLFINIDDATLDTWPAVPYTPRDKLLQLLRFGVENGAAAVLLDVNITRAIGGDRRALSPEDAALVDQLRRWAPPPGVPPGCKLPLIVLNREFRAGEGECRPVRRSFLDDALSGVPSPFAWGSVEFGLDTDHQIRYWHLSVKACAEKPGEGILTVPSVQLLVTSYLENRQRRGGEGVCALEAHVGGESDLDELADRIVYGIRQELGPGETRPTVPLNGRRVPVLTVVSAKDVTEGRGMLSGDLATGRVVVIGGSAEDARDLVSTPLGEMPGALVIVNSIYSLARYGKLHRLSRAAETTLALACVLVGSALLALVHGAAGYVLLALGTAAVFLPLSLWALRGGQWIDWAVPLLAVEGHHLFERVRDTMTHRRSREGRT